MDQGEERINAMIEGLKWALVEKCGALRTYDLNSVDDLNKMKRDFKLISTGLDYLVDLIELKGALYGEVVVGSGESDGEEEKVLDIEGPIQ